MCVTTNINAKEPLGRVVYPSRGRNLSLFARIKFNITETFGTHFNEGNWFSYQNVTRIDSLILVEFPALPSRKKKNSFWINRGCNIIVTFLFLFLFFLFQAISWASHSARVVFYSLLLLRAHHNQGTLIIFSPFLFFIKGALSFYCWMHS